MKKAINMLCLCLSMFAILGCNKNAPLKHPAIEYGIAKFSGKITSEDSASMPKLEGMELSVINNILAEFKHHDIPIDKDGTFSIEIPVTTNAWSQFSSKFINTVIPLSPNNETVLNIHFDKAGEKQVSIEKPSDYVAQDMMAITDAISITTRNYEVVPNSDDYNMNPEEFKSFIVDRISKIPNYIDSIMPDIPNNIKQFTVKELKTVYC